MYQQLYFVLRSNFEIMKKATLPLYVKLYSWFFCINAFIVIICAIISIFVPIDVMILGIRGTLLSFTGGILLLVSIFKGLLAFSILRGNPLAIKIGLIDAVLSFLIILFVTFYPYIVYPIPTWERRISSEIIFIAINLYYMIRLNKPKIYFLTEDTKGYAS